MDNAAVAHALTTAEDATLVEHAARGDRSAFELIMRRYNRRLYRLARACLRDDAEAKDVLQDAYLGAYRSLGQFRGESTLCTWLSRLVLNACAARQRRAGRRENIMPIVSSELHKEALTGVADAGAQPDHEVARAQMRKLLERKVSELPEIFRVVFVLRSVEEMSVEEIADALGVSHETVRGRHFRAKSKLRESLAQEIDMAESDIFDFGGRCCDSIVAVVMTSLSSERLTTLID